MDLGGLKTLAKRVNAATEILRENGIKWEISDDFQSILIKEKTGKPILYKPIDDRFFVEYMSKFNPKTQEHDEPEDPWKQNPSVDQEYGPYC